MKKPIIAIIGRKNVGKSTLLNRIAGRRISIVEDLPGTTRDRISVDVTWQGRDFTLTDTGGVEFDAAAGISGEVNKQIQTAIDEADIIIFMVSTRDGLLPDDIELANRLRRTGKKIILTANKAEDTRQETTAAEFYRLGFEELIPISAYHGRGVAELLDRIIALLPEPQPADILPETIKVAIVGKPNVGKSTLLNTMAGEERSIVDSTPGTTRDAVDTVIEYQGKNVVLIDTAGIKRQGKVEVGIERYSVIRSREAIERADITLLIIDASQNITDQDTHIAGYVQEAATGIIIAANKWDLTNQINRVEYSKYVREQFRFVSYAPIIYISAKTGQEIDRIMPTVMEVYQERIKHLPTKMVNNTIQQAIAEHAPPQKAGKRLKILYVTQAEINPPTFVFSVNDASLVHFSYQRYLENRLRRAFGFTGTPIRMVFKPRSKS
jgi:GTPase